MAVTTLYSGPNGSARSAQLDGVMREQWGHALLITPTVAYALRRRAGLLLESDTAGAWGAPVWEFKNFAVALLTQEGQAPRLLDNDERLWLLGGCLDRLRDSEKLTALGEAADAPGCVRHFLNVINQLKQAGIAPATFRKKLLSQASPSVFDEITALIYEAYQLALQESDAYDVPGLFWQVETICQQRCPKVLAKIDTLLFDGFDDFTPSQLRVIEALSRHLSRLVFGLNYDTRAGRKDLFALPQRTAAAIRQRFDAANITCDAPVPESYSQYAAEHCFWRDKPPGPKGLRNNLTLLSCSDMTQEIESIARRVKALLQPGKISPNAIAVVFRSLDEVAETVYRVFGEFGIPLHLKQEMYFRDSSVGRFLMRLFEAWEDWSADAVADVIAAPWFPCANDPAPSCVIERVIREAQILPGRENWVKRLNAVREALENEKITKEYRPLKVFKNPVAVLESVQNAVTTLMVLEKTFSREATYHDFALALDEVLDHWGVEEQLKAWPKEVERQTECCAVTALRALIEKLAERDAGEKVTRERFIEQFREALKECTFPRPDANWGVLCCDALSMRNLRVDHVFFGGLNEGIVPAPPPGNAVYPENERSRLRKAGIALEGKQEHADRERILFNHVLSAAKTSLCLSWRMQKDNGREASPSPFFTEIKDLFKDIPDVQVPLPVADTFIPEADTVASTRDFRNVIFHRYPALQRDSDLAWLQEAVTLEERRNSAQPCDAYDGILADSGLIDHLAERYGATHEFSVNQLEEYLDCPFQFFAKRLLHIEALERPVEEFDARIRGLILHDILEGLHKRYAGLSVPELPDAVEAQLEDWIDEAFARHGWKSATAPEGLLNAERRRMKTVLRRYLFIERETGQDQWKPRYFEAAFGRRAGKGDQKLSVKAPYKLEFEDGSICFTGRIDRVDLNAEGTQARIVDYKSSLPPVVKEMKSGQSLQLTLYAWALKQVLLPKIPCMEAHYIEVGKRLAKGDPNREGLGKGGKKPWREARETAARDAIRRSVSGIRAGHFPPFRVSESACKYCPCKGACRYQESRLKLKESQQG